MAGSIYPDLNDAPPEVLASAVRWVAMVLNGTIGGSIATLAVAAVGILMLTGHVPVRRGAGVVLGCFILFSAGSIASALTATVEGSEPRPVPAQAMVEPASPAQAPPPTPYDPYAGASVQSQSGHDLFQPQP